MSDDRRIDADDLAVDWEWALDAAARAVEEARGERVPAETLAHGRALQAEERRDVELLLHRWLPPRAPTARMLGLPTGAKAVILDLDGVLTDSNVLHAAAWAEALDPVLQQAAHDLDGAFMPFDRRDEYRLYFEGRPRLEGIGLFLASRGLRLPAESVNAIATRKSSLLESRLHEGRLVALPGARRYVQAAAYAHLGRAVVSASESTRSMLELARLDHLVDVVVDAASMRERSLRARPAIDPLLEACARLGVRPVDAVSLTNSGSGVVAALRAGLAVRGIGTGGDAAALYAYGAEIVTPSLLALLDHSIRPLPAEC
ncbi:MAG TPA: HAD family phosphatase [Gaiellaceae bacterium]|nr:HAD family phosphatase [Gaiellaceae bacterium]